MSHPGEFVVLKRRYWTGAFPMWNNWVKDPAEARRVVEMVEEANLQSHPTDRPIWFVAHSNGAVIALLAARELIAKGHRIGGLILTGAACEADLNKNCILQWYAEEKIGSAIAYCSECDGVVAGDPLAVTTAKASRVLKVLWRMKDWIWGRLMWPYGCLGRTGFLIREQPASRDRIFTRWFEGYGHSGYFEPENREKVFEQFYEDIREGHRQTEKGITRPMMINNA